MKNWWRLLALLVAMTALMMTAAVAEGTAATPSDLYEHEENDGHYHWRYCTNLNVCYLCGASISMTSGNITHQLKWIPYNDTYHLWQCTECGENYGQYMHTEYCADTGVCNDCGATGVTVSIRHEENIVGDETSHYWACIRCGEITSSKQAHWASCYWNLQEPGSCERCGEPYSGTVWHTLEDEPDGHDAVYHWFTCAECGEKVKEKHYVFYYYWYMYEDEEYEPEEIYCAGCGEIFDPSAVGVSQSRKPSSGVSASNSGITAGQAEAKAAETMTAAAIHGNTEGLPMALVYAPKTGKATLRVKASANAKAIKSLIDGTVVIVLEEGNRFTRVRVGDDVGYILTAALEDLDPGQLPLGEGMLTYKGRGAQGGTSINIRAEASLKARRIDMQPTGTAVIIWSVSEDMEWYEIEYDGVRGYVHSSYLTVTERYTFETPEEEEAEMEAVA